MPYEYRKLTPKEREAVLRQRRERGYPLHAPPHPFREAGRYLITGVNFEHAHIMDTPDRRTDFEARLMAAMGDIHAEVFGWAILPNHYHALRASSLISSRRRSSNCMAQRRANGTWPINRRASGGGTSSRIG
jgi:putative transposase